MSFDSKQAYAPISEIIAACKEGTFPLMKVGYMNRIISNFDDMEHLIGNYYKKEEKHRYLIVYKDDDGTQIILGVYPKHVQAFPYMPRVGPKKVYYPVDNLKTLLNPSISVETIAAMLANGEDTKLTRDFLAELDHFTQSEFARTVKSWSSYIKNRHILALTCGLVYYKQNHIGWRKSKSLDSFQKRVLIDGVEPDFESNLDIINTAKLRRFRKQGTIDTASQLIIRAFHNSPPSEHFEVMLLNHVAKYPFISYVWAMRYLWPIMEPYIPEGVSVEEVYTNAKLQIRGNKNKMEEFYKLWLDQNEERLWWRNKKRSSHGKTHQE